MDRKFKSKIQEVGLEETGRFYGLYHGFVVDNDDPEKRGRLKVKIPSILGEQIFEDWIYGKAIFNSNKIGIFAIPAIGSGIYITFINGDPAMPIWEMGWFADKEIPDEFKERYLDGITLKHDRIFIQSKEASIEIFEDGKIDIIGTSNISIESNGGKIRLKNSNQNFLAILNELYNVLSTLKVAMNGAPISNSLAPDSFAALNAWRTKTNQLFR